MSSSVVVMEACKYCVALTHKLWFWKDHKAEGEKKKKKYMAWVNVTEVDFRGLGYIHSLSKLVEIPINFNGLISCSLAWYANMCRSRLNKLLRCVETVFSNSSFPFKHPCRIYRKTLLFVKHRRSNWVFFFNSVRAFPCEQKRKTNISRWSLARGISLPFTNAADDSPVVSPQTDPPAGYSVRVLPTFMPPIFCLYHWPFE